MSRTTVTIHPLDPEDASSVEAGRAAARPAKGLRWNIEARASYDALMERVPPVQDVVFESDTVAGIAGLWVRPVSHRSDEALLHLHAGWFHAGSATGYRHLVAQIAARAGAQAFVPDYRLAPEHPFPAAVDDTALSLKTLWSTPLKNDLTPHVSRRTFMLAAAATGGPE